MTDRALPSEGWPPAVLDPAGPYSEPVTVLAWVLLLGGTLILVIVLGALWVALRGSPRLKTGLGGEKAIWILGFAFPSVVLTGLLVWGLLLTSSLSAARVPEGAMRVKVIGEMWWWRVHYQDGQGRETLRDANELHIPIGQPVLLELEAADVIHSFWVPRLGGKMDMIPGRTNRLLIEADAPGIYKGQCAEYCGGPHALMGFVVVAHTPADFARWQASRLPSQGAGGEGLALFLSSGCAACHTIRGTPARGLAGPDLTHVGSRKTLGAGILPNNPGTMAGWVADSQAIKPANRMPAYHQFSGEELQALTAYLVTLK
ncbi:MULTISPECIES: cytochrome c oxidase subunit II [unclassified Sphingopyxis]|uniref:cytochrome c oxidase subunit II n=1 Tax=unclassified Sphingopyxis TaxID=2614943 RepID=UPI00285696B4|nr:MULTISPECIES: cytochrome c oxidase subunit II [unclassified Sphingopyxis]MDR7060487.1 cytochrome c oxidase subunit 2 [Sphingopyxis sp. BE235]MDR7180000.1 cytochrome c oxidase subunit 2 [Sphingopyxis sp. BE249]